MNKIGKASAMVLGLTLSAAMPFAAQAQASKPGVYVGVAAGQSDSQKYQCEQFSTCNKTGSAYRFFTGWQFTRVLGVEFGYTDLGKVSSSDSAGTFNQTIKARATDITLTAQWPATERFALYGKVGGYYAATSADTTQSGVTQRVNQSRGNLTYGAGLQWFMIGSLAVRGEGQRYMKVTEGSMTGADSDYVVYTIGLLYKF